LAAQGIEGDETRGQSEFGEQCLRRGDFVGLIVDLDMGEHQGGVGGQGAEDLGGGAVVEVVETATQRLAIQSNAALSRRDPGDLQPGGVAAEDALDCGWVEPSKDVADGGMGGRAAPAQSERPIEAATVDVDEGDDATVRVSAGHDGEDGKQQHIWQLVALALRPARIRNFLQQAQRRRERSHGNPRFGCRPRSQRFAVLGIWFLVSADRFLRTCCISDSYQPPA